MVCYDNYILTKITDYQQITGWLLQTYIEDDVVSAMPRLFT